MKSDNAKLNIAKVARENNMNEAKLRARLRRGLTLDEAISPERRSFSVLGKSHKVEGKEYPNLPSIAKEYGIKHNTIYKRYGRGKRGDELVPEKLRKNYVEVEKPIKQKEYKYFVNGKGYYSHNGICIDYNIPLVTFRYRRRKGLSYEDSVKLRDYSKQSKKINIDGKTYSSIKEACEAYEMNKYTYSARLRQGLTPEEALKTPVKKKNRTYYKGNNRGKKITINNIEYPSISAAATAHNIPLYVVNQRISNLGYSPEEAFAKEPKSKKVVVEGKEFKSVSEAARFYKKDENMVNESVNKEGLTIEQALGIDISHLSNTLEYNGKLYRSRSELAEDINIKPNLLVGRLNRGMSLDEAILLGNEKILSEGRYNLTILERNKELANSEALLYFVELFLKEGYFFKIGITKRDVSERLEDHSYKEIKLIKNKLITCYRIEQKILNKFKKHTNKSEELNYFDGYTELFIPTLKLKESIIQELEKQLELCT